jgi:DNA excision repair protein ERCC-4
MLTSKSIRSMSPPSSFELIDHRLHEYSIEAFILRVFREHNPTGFVKAFSEDPETLITSSSGTQRIIQVMKLMHLRKLFLYPRNHPVVAETFISSAGSSSNIQQLDVIEMAISLTNPMKAIQAAILAAIRVCIMELKKSTISIGILDDVLSLENGQVFSTGLDRMIRRLLDPDWHRLSYRTKVSSLTGLE